MKKTRPRNLWFERLMAIVAFVNLMLVLFDLSYIPLRNFYFLRLRYNERPVLTEFYDRLKGIAPHRDTQLYLNKVESLKTQLENEGKEGLESPQAQALLAELQELSVDMIQTNPFALANKTGSLEKIKNKIRLRVFDSTEASAKGAFKLFWSSGYLQNDWIEAFEFYDQEIKPLIAINYFRKFGETGDFVDEFWRIDIWFVSLFALEFMARTWFISRRHAGLNWLDAMLWRWYDIFLLIPLVPLLSIFPLLSAIRWLRIIPVSIRLDQGNLIHLETIKKQASQGFVASIAEDLTEVVVIRIINQFQGSIRQGELSQFLSQQNVQPYIDINNTNETAELIRLIVNLLVNQVIPKIQPEAEALLQHIVQKNLNESPAYQGLSQLPGVERLQTQMTEQVISQFYNAFSEILKNIIEEDPVFDELLEKLVENLTQSLGTEIQAKESIERIEDLLNDLLEEIKINYVERLSEEDVEEILEQTRALRQLAQASPKINSSS